ncbi:hypothetical protein QR680_016464 [Steinernema hermaphroditum]|uniref:G-protein coupled receptors family 1 profile domain-containing protein n=1 Tax=Steinernema hermaphroditum TaxID=289476 RepID=A0AA39LMH3_9BILA|nr:hypothetical protein QR680_016464 [Steinernema hermaphroditum]
MSSANFVSGCIYGVLSVLQFIINALVLVVTLRFKEYGSVTYRIIKNMCISCLLQQAVFFIGALMSFSNSNFDYTFEKICGAVLQSSWILYISLSLTLAIDRMLTFVCAHLSSPVSYCLLSLSWLHASGHLIVLLLPNFGIEYCYEFEADLMCAGWYYDSQPGSYIVADIEPFILLALECSIFFCYIVVLVRLVKLKSMTNAKRQISSFRTELRILVIALLAFIYECSLIVFVHFGPELLPQSTSVDVLISTLWMLDSGLFSFVTLVINTYVSLVTTTLG